MTAEERREGGTRLCRQLGAEVARLAPPGIGRWEQTWQIVGDADTEYLIALTRWEATGSEDDKPPLRAAYYGVRDAWRRAAAAYEQERAGR